jgi:hypothetical protein
MPGPLSKIAGSGLPEGAEAAGARRDFRQMRNLLIAKG